MGELLARGSGDGRDDCGAIGWFRHHGVIGHVVIFCMRRKTARTRRVTDRLHYKSFAKRDKGQADLDRRIADL